MSEQNIVVDVRCEPAKLKSRIEREEYAISLGRVISFDKALDVYGSIDKARCDGWEIMTEHAGLMYP